MAQNAAGTQTVVQVHEYNREHPEEAVRVVQGQPVPAPGQGEVLVRLRLRPINPADLFAVQGVYPGFKPKELPAVPGLEGMGVVHTNGPGANKYKEGQRVTAVSFAAASGNGTWQQYACVEESKLVAVPDKVSDEAAAQFLVNPLTAYGMLDTLQVPKDGYFISNAASSVLGRMIIQLAKHQGVRSINLVRSAHHVEELKKLGADEVIVTTEEDLVQRVKDITGGKGAHGALECVGGDLTGKVVQAVRDGGLVCIYGAMAGFQATIGIPDLLFRDVRIHGFLLATYLASVGQRAPQVVQDVMRLLEEGVIMPYSGTRYPLERVRDAILETQKPQRGGKCLLEG